MANQPHLFVSQSFEHSVVRCLFRDIQTFIRVEPTPGSLRPIVTRPRRQVIAKALLRLPRVLYGGKFLRRRRDWKREEGRKD